MGSAPLRVEIKVQGLAIRGLYGMQFPGGMAVVKIAQTGTEHLAVGSQDLHKGHLRHTVVEINRYRPCPSIFRTTIGIQCIKLLRIHVFCFNLGREALADKRGFDDKVFESEGDDLYSVTGRIKAPS